MRWCALLVLSGIAYAGEAPQVDLPELPASEARPPKGEFIDLYLDANGILHVKPVQVGFGISGAADTGHERLANLKLLEPVVRGGAAWFDKARRGAGFEYGPGNRRWSRMHVVIHADRTAPWIQVQWLLATLHRVGVHRTWFAGAKDIRLKAWLPRADTGAQPLPIDFLKPVGDILPELAREPGLAFFAQHRPPDAVRQAGGLPLPPRAPEFVPWTGPKPPAPVPGIRLPELAPDPYESDHPALSIQLTADGRLYIVPVESAFGDGRSIAQAKLTPTRTTLQELGMHLFASREGYHLECRKQKRKDFEVAETDLGPFSFTRLNVVLFADREAPWLHVQWLMKILAEQKFRRVWFAVPGGRFRTFLLPLKEGKPEDTQSLPVDVVARSSATRAWGPPENRADVSVPTKLRYRFEGQEAESLLPLRAWLRSVTVRKGKPTVGRVRAQGRVPAGAVLEVLAEMKRARVGSVLVLGRGIPDIDLRNVRHLPYPDSNRLCRLWDEGADDD